MAGLEAAHTSDSPISPKLHPLEPSQRDGPRTLRFPVGLSSRAGRIEPFEVHLLHIWRLHAEAFFAD